MCIRDRKSLEPIFQDPVYKVRESALTRWRASQHGSFNFSESGIQGYSIKTDRYRLTKWGEKGEFGYELYDHKNDSQELNNLANDNAYKNVKDSLLVTINNRIFEANIYPESLGRQIENATPLN